MITGMLVLLYIVFGTKKAERRWWQWTCIITLPITVSSLAGMDSGALDVGALLAVLLASRLGL